MLRLLPLIFRNVLRNRRRTLLTLASTAVSLALLTVLFAIYQSFFHGDDSSPSSALRIITRHRVSLTQFLPASYEARIKSVDGVEQVSAWSWFGGTYKDPSDFFGRFAVDADHVFDVFPDWRLPPDQLAAFKRTRAGCAVGEKIAERYHIHLGDPVVITGDIYPVTLDMKCVAIYTHPPHEENLLFHREYLDELLKAQGDTIALDTVGTYVIRARTADEVPRVSRAIDAMFDNSPYPTRTESEKEFGRSFLGMLGNIRLFLAAICSAVTFTILLVSANTVAMAVRERTREMAILRTLGFDPPEILQLIVGESVVISMLGGIAGIGLGYLLCQSIDNAGGFPFQGLRWQAAAIVMGVAAVLGLFASLVPAFFAARANIVSSLRFVG
ncbi:MAG TPA: FtsX-like permease family protein [Phycisphaerae bacterium]|nr:FtsX-like permease family protein [Phycisphaerae bacterium]